MSLISNDLINKLKIPKLYETENLSNPLCKIKVFTPDSIWEWYIIEISIDLDTCYGYTKGFEGELGYFSLNELSEIRTNLGLGVERDLEFKPTRLSIIKKVSRC